ncbi:hypothetical protein EJB05_51512, partial [Eragrostis curvula]
MMSAAIVAHGPVRAVRHVGNLVLVASEDRVTLHESSTVYGGVMKLKHIMEVDTGPNPRGACALAQREEQSSFVLACPSPAGARAEVQVWHGASGPRVAVSPVAEPGFGGRLGIPGNTQDLWQIRHCMSPRGRLRDVACVELSRDARLLAAADSLGMFLYIFSTTDGMILQQLNMRGAMAEICCIAFSSDSKWLAVSSNQGVTLFCVRVLTPWTPVRDPDDPSDAKLMDPRTRTFFVTSFTRAMPVARFRLVRGVRYVAVAFGQETSTILAISMFGSLYRCEFDPVKGHMIHVEHMDLTEMKWRLLLQ